MTAVWFLSKTLTPVVPFNFHSIEHFRIYLNWIEIYETRPRAGQKAILLHLNDSLRLSTRHGIEIFFRTAATLEDGHKSFLLIDKCEMKLI